MFGPVFAALICSGVTAQQPDDFHAFVEATPTELRLGDPVFTRMWLSYKGKDPVMLSGWYTPSFTLTDLNRDTTFTFHPDVSATPGGVQPQEMKPGEKWLIGSALVKMPALECIDWPFWNASKLSKEPYRFGGALSVRRDLTVRIAGPKLFIRPRRKAEMRLLLRLCRERADAWRHIPDSFDHDRPTINRFGFTFAPPECSTPENLAILEKALSPGSLRDIVHLTRLSQAVYNEKDLPQRRKATTELLGWLDKRPEIERHIMAGNLVSWASQNKGLEGYLFEFVDQIIPRLPKESQEKCRKSNNDSRQRYLEYLRKQKD